MADIHIDPSQNYLEHPKHPLHDFFNPQTVAIIGAKEQAGSVGRTLLSNMQASFKGEVFPVNPKYPEVLGLKSYPRIQDIPKAIDLAVIVTPSKLIPSLIDDCVLAKVKSVIIISAGFKEIGEEGVALENEVLARAHKGNIRIIGPNCLGLMNPHVGLNATFAADMANPGNMAFISQSGALCTAVLDWSLQEKIGFSAFISIGSMSDVQWADLIDYLDQDPNTHSILIYMETVGDARSFLSAARQVVFNKPIILIKAGRTEAAAAAAASHTGALAGADDVFEAAIERVGILRVDTIGELFNMAAVLAKQPRPQGARLAIVTNAGGPAVLATDATLIHGAELAKLSDETIQKLNQFLPSAWSHHNPVDILGDGDALRYQKTLEVLAEDPNVDGMLVILTPQDMTESTATAQRLKPLPSKPLLASWMGGRRVAEGIEILNTAGVSTFAYPDSACKAFAKLWTAADHLKLLYETPVAYEGLSEENFAREKKTKAFFSTLEKENRTLLTEAESKSVLADYGIPVVQTLVATTLEEAVFLSEKIGYPVVLKLHSLTITHKSDVGGVKLNLRDRQQVQTAYSQIEQAVSKENFQGVAVQKMISKEGYEVILGSSVDPQFGPILLFGAGGELVEVFKDRALGVPPLTTTLAKKLMRKTKIYRALQGVRGRKAVDLASLEKVIIRFSQFIVEQPRIKECDINPLIVSDSQVIALDARIVLHDFAISDKQLPKPAIRPYPIQYIRASHLKNGAPITLRPLRPEDEPLLVNFHKELSEETVRQRYFGFISLEKRIAHQRLIKSCHCDYDREIILGAEVTSTKQIVGACRLDMRSNASNSELKMIIIDRFQRLGLGTQFLEEILKIAALEGIQKVHARILQDNVGMLHLCKKYDFTLQKDPQNPSVIIAEKNLHPSS